ncbi:hypothetical protein ACSFA2_25245 [Variovorax sp. LT2P21]|uniref:hypothetical protein n=1 Tax=Variovorax sp. LT2P21 TaxID=3443731 RepID=UPI003F45690A
MSYYTRFELQWNDADYALGTLTPDMVANAAAPFVNQRDWSLDVLTDLRASATGQGLARPGFNGVDGASLVEMVQAVSLAFPAVTFVGRGIGEDILDTWIRIVQGGEVLKKFGPFEASTADALNTEPSEALNQRKPWWKF